MGDTVQMPQVILSTDDVIEAFCKMLEPGIDKTRLNVAVNRYGVDVIYNRKDPSLIMFHFVSKELFEFNIVLDMKELERRGKEYLDHLFGLMCDQVEQARKVKQEEGEITIHTGSHAAKKTATPSHGDSASPPKLKESVAAHNEVFH